MNAEVKLADLLGSDWIPKGDPRFEQTRRVYNGDIDRRPSGIAQPRSKRLAIDVVRILGEAGLPYTVRCGGHNVAGRAVGDETPMLDLGNLTGVEVDSETFQVRVEGGARWANVDMKTQQHALAVPGGIVPSTGVGGLTLGGGIGWILPWAGLTCDNLVQATVTTTDGEFITCSADVNPELLRALRGGGHGLGVVLEFVFRAHPLAGVIGGWMLFKQDKMSAALECVAELLPEISSQIMISPALMWRHGSPVCEVDIVASNAAQSEMTKLTAKLNKFNPMENTLRRTDYLDVQRMTDNPARFGMPAYWRSSLRSSFPPGLATNLVDVFLDAPTTDCLIMIEHYHGAYSNEPEGGSSYPHRRLPFNILAVASWQGRRGTEAYERRRSIGIEWAASVETVWRAHERLESAAENSLSRYVNYDSRREAISNRWIADPLLRKLRSRLDPQGLIQNT
jgi:FAD binding domain